MLSQSTLDTYTWRDRTKRTYHCCFEISAVEETCAYTSKVKSNMKVHLMSHLKFKGHPCNLCDRAFVTKQNLTDHQRRHRD